MILPTPTPLQRAAQAGAEAIHYAATVLRAQYDAVWGRDPETVAAELNADVPTSVLLMELHNQAATALNALLDTLNAPQYSTRAQTSMPEYWSFADGAFSYSPPPPPEPEPEPDTLP